MSVRKGWTLVEMFVVIAIIVMLTGLLVPSLQGAREQARRVACAAALREIHQGVISYTAANDQYLPPFSFSSYAAPSLPVSGHWGGFSQPADPDAMGRKCTTSLSVNLWSLVSAGMARREMLVCPSARAELRTSQASYFPYTSKYSTYCLRFPCSEDLFRESPAIARTQDNLLSVYCAYEGGASTSRGVVPLVRIDRRYRIGLPTVHEYEVATDAMLADTFWWQDWSQQAASKTGVRAYPACAKWCHGRVFNVLTGGGAVRAIADQGDVVARHTNAPNRPADDGSPFQAAYAETIWRFFDSSMAQK